MRRLSFLFVLLAFGCANPTLWKFDALETGLAEFDSARLLYSDPKSASPLRFEIDRIGYEIVAYLNLAQYKLTQGPSVVVSLKIGDEVYEEELPILEGRMRLRLSQTMTRKLVLALQEGKSVKFSTDGFEETLQCDNFTPLYQKLVKNTEFLQNILQGMEE